MNGELLLPFAANEGIGEAASPAPEKAARAPAEKCRAQGDRPHHPLSVSRERFCQNLTAGMNATQAYLAAFPKSSAHAARVNASCLRRKPAILRRMSELNAEAESDCLMRRARRLERLREIAESPDANTRDVIAAIKTINDMAGDGEPPNAPKDGPEAGLLALLRRIRAGD